MKETGQGNYSRMYAVSCLNHREKEVERRTKARRISAFVHPTASSEEYPELAEEVIVLENISVAVCRVNIIFPCFDYECDDQGIHGGHVRARSNGRILIIPSCREDNTPHSGKRHEVKSVYQEGENALWLEECSLREGQT